MNEMAISYPITCHILNMRAIAKSGRLDDATSLYCAAFASVKGGADYFDAWNKYKSLAVERDDMLHFPDGSAYDRLETRRAPKDCSEQDRLMAKFVPSSRTEWGVPYGEYFEPNWDERGPAPDWREEVPPEVRAIWSEFTVDQRRILANCFSDIGQTFFEMY